MIQGQFEYIRTLTHAACDMLILYRLCNINYGSLYFLSNIYKCDIELEIFDIHTPKVGPTASTSSSLSLFYLYYYVRTDGNTNYFLFSAPGLSERSAAINVSGWLSFKVDQRLSGSDCITTLYLSMNKIFETTHSCGSYTSETTSIWVGGQRSDITTGTISSLRFVWLE